ncbi:hypothetical protein D3C86_1758850 [compost metagenome]
MGHFFDFSDLPANRATVLRASDNKTDLRKLDFTNQKRTARQSKNPKIALASRSVRFNPDASRWGVASQVYAAVVLEPV